MRIFRPRPSWLALLARLQVPPDSADGRWVQIMRDKLADGWEPTTFECANMERLRDTYGETESGL